MASPPGRPARHGPVSAGRGGDESPLVDHGLPRIPVSAGGLIGDGHGRILILKPTYKAGWTIPGGQIEESGETPWEGCRREVAEETALEFDHGRLVCVDFLRPRELRPGGLRFVFDLGNASPTQRRSIVLQAEEIEECRWASPDEADRLLSGPVRRRVRRSIGVTAPLYLEDGRPVTGMTC